MNSFLALVHVKMNLLILALLSFLCFSNARLLVDYRGGQPASQLGMVQYEGQYLGDHVDKSSDVYIRPGTMDGEHCLHYHRAAHFRRAEVKALGKYAQDEHYYIGYELQLSHSLPGLVLFQW